MILILFSFDNELVVCACLWFVLFVDCDVCLFVGFVIPEARAGEESAALVTDILYNGSFGLDVSEDSGVGCWDLLFDCFVML